MQRRVIRVIPEGGVGAASFCRVCSSVPKFDAFGMFRRAPCPPAPLALACGFALYDEDTTTHGMHRHIQTRTHTPCAVSFSL